MKVLCVFGEHNYGDPSRGEGYEHANFIPALRRLGHEVVFFESANRQCYPGFRHLNSALLRAVETHRPDVVFLVLTHFEIWLETLEILRDSGQAAVVNWATDDSWKYAQFSRLVAPATHAFATTYPQVFARYQRDGIQNVVMSQWGADPVKLRPPLPAAHCHYGVSFVGSAHGNRTSWIDALRRRGIEVECFGHGWPRGSVSAEQIGEIMRSSVISLNFANSALIWDGLRPVRSRQLKARTFEVPGAGGFLLTEWAEGLDRYYQPGREIELFHGLEELTRKIRHFLEHGKERDEIAAAGYQRTVSEHTYDRRLSTVLDFALVMRDKRLAGSEPSPLDWGKFRQAEQRHRWDAKLVVLRRMLVAMCSKLWGPKRGPRAARRLVFELSWRIAGAHTYSAAGWPGRMFYEVS
jgi:spore maturation protein CgeB